MNDFDYLKKLAPGLVHADWDKDKILDGGEALVDERTGERYAVATGASETLAYAASKDGSGFIPANAEREYALPLVRVSDGAKVSALWRDGRIELSAPPSLSDLSIDDEIGALEDDYFMYEDPLSEAFLDYQAVHGSVFGLARSALRAPLPVLASGVLGAYPTREALVHDVTRSGWGSFLSFQKPTGEWSFRLVRVKNSAGELRNIPGVSDEEFKNLSFALNRSIARVCAEGFREISFHGGFEIDTEMLARDERVAEINFAYGEFVGEALDSYLRALPPDERETTLAAVLDSDQPNLEIQHLLAGSLGLREIETYPPTGPAKGKKVFIFNAANVSVNTTMRTLFSLSAGGLMSDDVARLREAGFEVVLVQCASSKDLLDAMYADSTAGIFWFGHAGPGGLASSHGFGIDLKNDVDWKRVSPSLKAFHVLGCDFMSSFPVMNETECHEATIRDYFPPDVHLSGFDRLMLSYDIPIEKTAAGGIARSVDEIIARTPPLVPPSDPECVDENGLAAEPDGDNEDFCADE